MSWASRGSWIVLGLLDCLMAHPALAGAVPDLVRDHSPLFVSRKDQIRNPETDRLLAIGYSVAELPSGEQRIRYTAFFSDEDSIHTVRATDLHQSRYGRRLDIEWAFDVVVDPRTGDSREAHYQCDAFLGIGHRSCAFDGRFVDGTHRPILYVTTRHNTLGSGPAFPYGSRYGRRLDLEPLFEIPFPTSRDWVPVENPELLRTSDEELALEGKRSAPSTEYAYVRVRGSLTGWVHIGLVSPSGETYWNGRRGGDSLKEMGLDLWGQESVVAIRLPDSVRLDLRTGITPFHFTLRSAGLSGTLHLDDLGLALVERSEDGRYVPIDLSSRIRCASPGDLASCVL